MKVFTKTIELTEAQIEALHTTSLDVLAAPNVGYAVIPVAAQIWKTAGASATSADADVILSYEGAGNPILRFSDADGVDGALRETVGSIQFGVFDSGLSSVGGAKKVEIAATEAISCATGTKLKVSVDFKIVKL